MTILNILAPILAVSVGFILLLIIGSIIFYLSFYRKVPQGQALVRTGRGGIRVAFDEGMLVEENTPEEFFNNPKSDRTKLFLSQIL